MRSECDQWKKAANSLQQENTQLQKDALKMTRDLMDKQKQLKDKTAEIQRLSKPQQIDEALCQKCQQSLEESFHMTSRDSEDTNVW